ncbi:MAG: translation initiation factor IF-2 [Candidatus Sungbacteria bacterium RIFCSPLOWO2_12_FULL_41_11]|uniref:Translation initiation factor IF-2 n=1 Tax=Candidatus Sungbacteria bacterium RIFCSPLOWO2_12_FULL_41_11 TaxID=1802286 RepID=A0A1G2LT02_9BACT|nr:MAG: translation initiation factor IF-2 [Candidatus Sungbacteria bacterium RIFCSPLOWO2_12_FULL_41_11]
MVKKIKKTEETEKYVRSPIVVVMGHIDHGKTKILDWYRKTKVVESESGGITQHIGAYEVLHKGKKITFIDTPGHEAFSKMRSRGAKVADIAILVVAADEGVKPQTKEAIEIIRQNNLAFIVAINKIDKPEANPEKVKQELAKENVLVESYGGKVPSVEISAKIGKNMDDLLELILLMAELENLEDDHKKPAEGVVVESHLDPRRGATATLLLQTGSFIKNDFLAIGGFAESIKILEDFLGRPIESASSSMPVIVASLQHVPVIGDTFASFEEKTDAEKFASSEQIQQSKKIEPLTEETTIEEIAVKEKPLLEIVLKSDVAGSREALEATIIALDYPEAGVKILKNELGDIVESDIKTAQAGKNIIVCGFKVEIGPVIKQLAESNGIKIIIKEIIYELIDALKSEMSDLILPEIKRNVVGKAKILATFKLTGTKQVIGGKTTYGKLKRGLKCNIIRNKESAGEGKILQLQQQKKDVNEVAEGMEFGVLVDSTVKIQKDDEVEVFEEEIFKKRL